MECHGFIESTDGTRLALSVSGPRHAPVTIVFSHGLALSRHVWRPQCRHLSRLLGDKARLVFYDHRGHGASTEPPPGCSSYSLAQIGTDLATVINHVAPNGPVIVVGHSLGGMAIMAMAHHHPEILTCIAGVALISTAAHALSTSGVARALRTPAVPLLERLVAHAPELTHQLWTLARAAAGPLLGIPTTRVLSGEDTVSIRAVVAILSELRCHDQMPGLTTLQEIPACIIACGDADPVTPFHHSLHMAEQLPQAQLIRAPRAGHMLPLERPRLISEAVAALSSTIMSRPEQHPLHSTDAGPHIHNDWRDGAALTRPSA